MDATKRSEIESKRSETANFCFDALPGGSRRVVAPMLLHASGIELRDNDVREASKFELQRLAETLASVKPDFK